MGGKRRHHLIPQVYLRGFCDSRRPDGHPEDRPFTPALWQHPPDLNAPPVRVAPRNVAWETDAYRLVRDDPARPLVEEQLSRLEGLFADVMRRQHADAVMSIEDIALLALFVGALQARTKGMMAQRQADFDTIAGFTRAYMGDAADKSAEPWGEVRDAGKRQIAISAEAFAEVAGPHTVLVDNATPMGFITSDHPVSYEQTHADELEAIGIPAGWMYRAIPRTAREFFVFCPLTPRLGFLASRFFPPQLPVPRHRVDDLRLIVTLNELTRTRAERMILSASPAPYGPMLPAVHAFDERRAAAAVAPRNGVQIYGARDRYWLPTTLLLHGDAGHPLRGRISFCSPDLGTLRRLAEEPSIDLIEVVRDGRDAGGMRDAWLTAIAIAADGETIIENGPGGPTFG